MKLNFSAFFALAIVSAAAARTETVPSFQEAMEARRDAWGEAAMAQPNGPSYEFFAPLLPAPRYVNADFHYYPILLSAPNATTKARLISDGSGVNLRGGTRSWNDNGVPFTFRVGPDELRFGSIRERLDLPTLAEDYLPIAEIRYRHATPVLTNGAVPLTREAPVGPPEIYALEAFASTDAALAEHGVVFVKFSLPQGAAGIVTVHVDANAKLALTDGRLTNDRGELLAWFGPEWKWERGGAHAPVTGGSTAVLAIATKPFAAGAVPADVVASAAAYAAQRKTCADTWRGILARGMRIEVPEPVVANAARHLLLQNFVLLHGDRIHYSAGNQYDKLYEAEGSDAAITMMTWGYPADMRRMIEPLLDFTRRGLEYHQAGFKLNDVCQYFWQTRDAAAVEALRPRWEKEERRLVDNRTGPHGLFPADQYCGDITTPVQSVNVNAKAWRALRDLSAMLAELGRTEEAAHYARIAADFRKTVLAAIEASARREGAVSFVPVALYDNEPAHNPISATKIGSYWNIIIGYTIASGIFPAGSAQESWIPHYLEQCGGLCMGMPRFGPYEFTFWNGTYRTDALYGTRYALDALRRDDPERALVCFYGMLAQGFTRNTFISGEVASLTPLDDGGRFIYCPPNSAANGHLLSMLRHLLVQDSDLDDDGRPETLRLLFATPKRWLEDGKAITVERAPTAFGEVSLTVQSRLRQGEIVAEVSLPARNPAQRSLLRFRVPDGWRAVSATAGAQPLAVDAHGTIDLSALKGRVTIRCGVERVTR